MGLDFRKALLTSLLTTEFESVFLSEVPVLPAPYSGLLRGVIQASPSPHFPAAPGHCELMSSFPPVPRLLLQGLLSVPGGFWPQHHPLLLCDLGQVTAPPRAFQFFIRPGRGCAPSSVGACTSWTCRGMSAAVSSPCYPVSSTQPSSQSL